MLCEKGCDSYMDEYGQFHYNNLKKCYIFKKNFIEQVMVFLYNNILSKKKNIGGF